MLVKGLRAKCGKEREGVKKVLEERCAGRNRKDEEDWVR